MLRLAAIPAVYGVLNRQTEQTEHVVEFTTNTRNKNVSAVDISEWTLGLGREYGGVWGGGGRGETQEVRLSNPESGEELHRAPVRNIRNIFQTGIILLFQVRPLRGQREEFFSEIKSQIKE